MKHALKCQVKCPFVIPYTAATIELDMREMEELAFGLNKENEEKMT